VTSEHYADKYCEQGMSLRDYYAGKAMASILSTLHQGIRPCEVELMAKDAFAVADAMMAARVA